MRNFYAKIVHKSSPVPSLPSSGKVSYTYLHSRAKSLGTRPTQIDDKWRAWGCSSVIRTSVNSSSGKMLCDIMLIANKYFSYFCAIVQ